MNKSSSLYDRNDSFGWISIGLHWFATLSLILLWFIGQSIASVPAEEFEARRSLHVTLGLVLWLPLLARILWRIKSRHPRVKGQSLLTHRLAKLAHYSMLVLLGTLMISGPLMALALTDGSRLMELAFTYHGFAAKVLAVLVLIHIIAAMKHLMFHDDETIARIFVPRKEE